MRFDGITIEYLDIEYGYKYSMPFRYRLMRFDDIVVKCIGVNYG